MRTVILRDRYDSVEHVDIEDPLPMYLGRGTEVYLRIEGVLYRQVSIRDITQNDIRRVFDTRRSFRLKQ